ncbi:SH3 domain-containing protein [Sphaerimonospora sp. CA-214678]|uniref:SH3 domain-containing protein n=1 Tax=Sphaerimonospora sp. CA-214678 TaxID=3240029 RepID=UPI003D9354B2
MRIAKRIIPALTACAAAGWLVITGPSAQADIVHPDPETGQTSGILVPTQPSALSCTYKVRNVRKSSFLNVRKGPGLKYRPVGRLTVDSGRFAGACSPAGHWVKIEFGDGERGWVHTHYVRRLPATTDAPSVLPDLSCAYRLKHVRKSSFLNVRKGPSPHHRRIGRLRVSDGRFLGACDSTHGWTAVKAANGRSGWAFTDYLRRVA